ncbi:MAG: hypothetical protein AAGA28_03895 [Pseudomonadota bacterium]
MTKAEEADDIMKTRWIASVIERSTGPHPILPFDRKVRHAARTGRAKATRHHA